LELVQAINSTINCNRARAQTRTTHTHTANLH